MLTYDLERSNGTSLYLYIYECIRQDILNGVLKGDSPLPSKRNFASNLGVSNITVENAYAQLMAEGYIYSKPRRGFFVTPLADITQPALPQGNITIQKSIHTLDNTEEYIYDLTGRQTQASTFPFSVWAKLMRETLSFKQEQLLIPSPSGGIYELRGAIANYLMEYRNMDVAPEQIIIGSGTEYLYSLIIQLLGFDKIYGLENPGYVKLGKIFDSFHVSYNPVDMDAKGISIESLEDSNIQILHTSPSHHFPLGIVTGINRRYQLLNWLGSNPNRYIIEDDYDSEFRLSGKPVPTLTSIDKSGRTIYMNTFTKSLASTIRISYMVLPHELLERFNKEMSFYSCTVPSFEQYTLADFLNQGYFEKHLNRQRTRYKKIKTALITAIKTNPILRQCNISEENGGLHFLLSVNNDFNDEYILKKAKEKGLRLSALSQYYLDTNLHPNGTFIINYSSISEDQIEPLVSILEEVF